MFLAKISETNMLIFRLQPDEGMLIKFNLKKPAEKSTIINKNLEFHYKKLGDDIIDDAYETLILDVFKGNSMLFSRSDFVEKAWEIVDPIIKEINNNNNNIKLYGYKAGTWGPKKCDDLFRNENGMECILAVILLMTVKFVNYNHGYIKYILKQ